ncbi:DUF1240 domain-containing protein [Escherichia coli]|nr:DUF1240 domain-containing protein [Escherichia coli]EFE8994115.1 DUF1240 domain-containing protein [Escherichia coli]EFH3306573.1 DUF1240 domain-containing protein [Escherichia coli]EFI6898947.1 DUF1240 domain-containing protein [Escherichia coli]EHT6560986.1 DUF1240 domain-containing protein [Escherichia coli]
MTINILKEKLKLTCGAIFIFFYPQLLFFFGCYATYELFLWNDIIVYSWGYMLIIFLPFTLYVMSFEILFFAISGRRLSKVTMVRLWLIIKIIIAFSICAMLIFSSIYKKELLSRNYIACSGIPSGWMPGLATKYVKEKTSCEKNGNN